MVKVKRLRSKTSTKARMWDTLPWKPVDVDRENLGDFEESVFFGLEEIDGNAYKLSKGGDNVIKPIPVEESEEVPEKVAKASKKSKKSSAKGADTGAESVIEETAVSSVPTISKKDSKKRKQTIINVSDIENAVVDSDIAPAVEKKKKQKKGSAPVEITQNIDMDSSDEGQKLVSLKSLYINAPAALVTEDVSYLKNDSEWAPGLLLSDLLKEALLGLGFKTPTPIQTSAIPLATVGGNDIVGAAETGSGKTLAFSLPIIHSLLHNWESCSNLRIPHALIIAPTRELALQIATVIREVCTKVGQLCEPYKTQEERAEAEAASAAALEAGVGTDIATTIAAAVEGSVKLSKKALKAQKKKQLKAAGATAPKKRARVSIEIVSIVGGMSEQKQRRQLAGKGKPVHIVVATPGRLCEMFEDPENVSFQDMSKLRFLVVDEADRIMEEGHYAELHRVFSRIRDHEEIAERGEDPVTVNKARARGTFEDPDADLAGNNAHHNNNGEAQVAMDVEDLDQGEVDVPMMPSEEEIQRMREECAALGAEAYHADAHLIDEAEESGEGAGDMTGSAGAPVKPVFDVGRRQTLLFSATAIHAAVHNASTTAFDKKAKAQKKLKLKGTLKGITQNNTLPDHLKQLLCMVGIQKNIHVVDVTSQGQGKKATDPSAVPGTTSAAQKEVEGVHRLPAGLTQEELHVPSDEKDVYAYYYINKFPGRTLVFVNSIKTARRLDGLLRALGINCRALHAQLQQKQRLNALESFSDLPVGVLVATDVAARGLDISKIQSVIHYDVARSPQVYVHRSGRTARANQTGTAVSLVSPEDTAHHKAICAYLGFKALPLLHVDLYSLPMLRQRVTLAKQIFVQSFIASQASKDKHWLTQSCKDADLEIDEFMQAELAGDEDEELSADATKQKEHLNKKAIALAKHQLQVLLDQPIPDARTYNTVLKKKQRAESRGGKAPPTAEVQAARAAAKVAGGKKGKNKAAPVVEDSSWKRRSSFFVFAK